VQIEYRSEYSGHLGRQMEYKIYGHRGKPVIAFPTMYGRFNQWEDFGMIGALSGLINEGRIQVWTVDGIDSEHVKSTNWDMLGNIKRYDQYMGYMRDELLPAALAHSRYCNDVYEIKAITTGCSLGAFHAANFFFHQPWQLDGLVALSGVYSTQKMFGDYKPDEITAYSPLNYLQGSFVDERWEAYQRSKIIIACGQGDWEDDMRVDTNLMREILDRRSIPAWIDYWGHDVNHDWPWWFKMLPYYLDKIA